MKEDLKELILASQEQDRARINELAVLNDENKKQLAEAVKYTNYYPDPITKDFQRKYILSDIEFATEESKLAQSITELNVRTDNLMNDAYQYKKTELEIEKLQLEQKLQLREITSEEFDQKVGEVEADLIGLEIANKQVALRKIKLQSNARFKEAMAWKGNVEESLQKLGKQSVNEVDLDQIRMDLMREKIKKWGELYAEGTFEMTPSKLQAIESEKAAFNEGVNIGLSKLKNMLSAEQFAKRLAALGVV